MAVLKGYDRPREMKVVVTVSEMITTMREPMVMTIMVVMMMMSLMELVSEKKLWTTLAEMT